MNGGDSYNSVCECSNLHNTKECDPQDLRLVKVLTHIIPGQRRRRE